jgi:serine/threonine-protein kinase
MPHQNVCRVYDIGEADGRLFLSAYVDGEELSSLLKRIECLAPDKAAEVAAGLAAGLAATHAQGVLHRDLKPSNIMINKRGAVRVMYFRPRRSQGTGGGSRKRHAQLHGARAGFRR